MIALNMAYLFLDADYNEAASIYYADWQFVFLEIFFTLFFTVEITIRFFAFQRLTDAFQDFWFKMDFLIVLLIYVENTLLVAANLAFASKDWYMQIEVDMKSVKLLKLFRVVRIARAMPEVMTVLQGLQAAITPVSSTIFLLVGLIYLFAILFRYRLGGPTRGWDQLDAETAETPEEFLERVRDSDAATGRTSLYKFRSVKEAAFTLLWAGTMLDGVGVIFDKIRGVSAVMATVFVVYVMLTNLTLLSMLIGVLCEVITTNAARVKEDDVVRYLRSTLSKVFDSLDRGPAQITTDRQGLSSRAISRTKFRALLGDPMAAAALAAVDIDVQNLRELEVYFFGQESEEADERSETMLGLMDFVELVLSLRNTNTATVLDITQTRNLIQQLSGGAADRRKATSQSSSNDTPGGVPER